MDIQEKQVIFVMGMSGVGKSFYIKEQFPHAHVLDLLDFQKALWADGELLSTERHLELVWQSYHDLRSAISKALAEHPIVIVEHTLLRAERRAFYLDVLKDGEAKIIGHFLTTTQEKYLERNPGRGSYWYTGACEVQEIPTKAEDFDELIITDI